MKTIWYCRLGATEQGPMSAVELLGLARGGLLRRADPVRKGLGGKWMQAARVHGLFPESAGATATLEHDADEQDHAPGPRLLDPAGCDEAAEFWRRARAPACPDCGEHMAGLSEDEWLLGRAVCPGCGASSPAARDPEVREALEQMLRLAHSRAGSCPRCGSTDLGLAEHTSPPRRPAFARSARPRLRCRGCALLLETAEPAQQKNH